MGEGGGESSRTDSKAASLTSSPDVVEDEEELDEHTAEWQDASHEGRGDWETLPVLVRNLTWDLVGRHRLLIGLQYQHTPDHTY